MNEEQKAIKKLLRTQKIKTYSLKTIYYPFIAIKWICFLITFIFFVSWFKILAKSVRRSEDKLAALKLDYKKTKRINKQKIKKEKKDLKKMNKQITSLQETQDESKDEIEELKNLIKKNKEDIDML